MTTLLHRFCLFIAFAGAAGAFPATTTVSWTEPAPRGPELNRLTVSFSLKELPASLLGDSALQFVRRTKENTISWKEEQKEKVIDLAFPIRVAGQRAPQVFVLSHNSWGQHVGIYSIGGEGVRRIFGCNIRDFGSVHWKQTKGALISITVDDRWDPASVTRESYSEPGIRWERVSFYKFDAKSGEWTVRAAKWQKWNVNDDRPLKEPFTGMKDCPFGFAE